eukprot:1348191-Heterocapsa_arctica.AAC.1
MLPKIERLHQPLRPLLVRADCDAGGRRVPLARFWFARISDAAGRSVPLACDPCLKICSWPLCCGVQCVACIPQLRLCSWLR